MVLGNVTYQLAMSGLGYFYPAVSCYRALQELNAEQMVLWCKYWSIIGIFSAVTPIADVFLFWAPLYNELKLAFAIFLWYPNMRGTDYVWRTYVAPYLDKHEEVIEAWSAWLSSVFGENVSRVAQLAQQRAKEALFTTVYGGQLPEPKKKVEAVSPSPHKDDPAVSNMLSRKSSRQTEAEALDQAPSMDMSPAAIRQRTKSAFQDIVDSVWSFD